MLRLGSRSRVNEMTVGRTCINAVAQFALALRSTNEPSWVVHEREILADCEKCLRFDCQAQVRAKECTHNMFTLHHRDDV
jgi:hypothetical protein